MTTPPGYIVPQSASAPITTNLRKDELAALQTVDQNATADQRVIATGNSIPIVFGVYASNKGGVWVTPPAARYGLQIDEATGYSFSYGLVLSDGYVPPIDESDIYQGVSPLTNLLNYKTDTVYDNLATTDYNYTLTYTTAGTPDIPGTPDTPGYFADATETISDTDLGFLFFFSGTNYTSVSASVRFEVWDGSIASYVPTTATGTIDLGAASTSYTSVNNASYNGTSLFDDGSSFTMNFQYDSSSGLFQTTYEVIRGYKEYVPGTEGTPDTPGVPSVTSVLPLFPGSGGIFSGMTTLAVKGRYALEADQQSVKQQIRCFVRNGIHVEKLSGETGSSDSFPDLTWHLLTNAGKVPVALIDKPSFVAAETFTAQQQMRFNGVLANSVNLRDYLSRVAPMFLLRFVQVGGKFALRPALPVVNDGNFNTDAIIPSQLFDESNIVVGSFTKNYIDANQRKLFCALMTWRYQSDATFGEPKTTEVRYEGTAIDGPFEQYDMEEFCTTELHATTVGKYIIASRKHTSHIVSFQTTALVGTLGPTDIISVTWNYATSLGNGVSSNLYQVDSVTEGLDGVFRVEATHFPVTASGASQVIADMIGAI